MKQKGLTPHHFPKIAAMIKRHKLNFFHRKNGAGFTLIELLVVIAVIGLLASIISVATNTVRDKARTARVQAEITQFIKVAVIAQGQTGSNLIGITAGACSDCACRGFDIRNIATTHTCYTNWTSALNAIQNSSGGTVAGLDKMTRDPWGSPYALDENERESGPTDCTRDSIRSVGSNGLWGDSDDINYEVPNSRPCS